MTYLMFWVFLLVAVLFVVPTLVLSVELLAACFLPRRVREPVPLPSRRLAVLIPAHNEQAAIAATVSAVRAKLRPADRILVVADNCTDETARRAAEAGAEVAERTDSEKRGKGYALAHGVAFLAQKPPSAVVFLDADCRVTGGSLALLGALCESKERPVQALDLMTAPKGMERRYAVAVFAWIVKNQVRPSGLSRLNLPCQLMGTGMAIPWHLLEKVDLASAHLAEDVELGQRLARLGHPPLFCVDVVVESSFPQSEGGAIEQRRRWEQGSVSLLVTLPRQIWHGLRTRNKDLLAMALDQSVPPLVLHGAALGLACLLAMLALPHIGLIPLFIFLGEAVFFGLTLLLCWMAFGQEALPLRLLVTIPSYLFSKLAVWRRRQRRWTRADRN